VSTDFETFCSRIRYFPLPSTLTVCTHCYNILLFILFFNCEDEHVVFNTNQCFEHKYLHALANLATAAGIEL